MTRDDFHFEIAILASLLLHAAAFGCWQYRATLGRFPVFSLLAKAVSVPSLPSERAAPQPRTITFVDVVEPEKPRTFMETDEEQVTGETPRDAGYYSDKATVAANPENPTQKAGDTPYLDGRDSPVKSTVDVPFTKPVVAAPVAPPVPPAATVRATPPEPRVREEPLVEKKTLATEEPQPTEFEGLKLVEETMVAMIPKETALPKADAVEPPPEVPVLTTPPSAPATGREVASTKSQLKASGASRAGVAAFNVAESPFGLYDRRIVRAVQSRWYALIERYGIYERTGVVTLHFHLLDDGSVNNLHVKDNSAGQILALFCEKAIIESGPFDPLPETLRVLVGKEPREVNFTFYY